MCFTGETFRLCLIKLTGDLRPRSVRKIHRTAEFGGLLYFFDRPLVQRLVYLNQQVLFINFDCLNVGVTAAQNAATQPEECGRHVAIAQCPFDVRADNLHPAKAGSDRT